MTRAGAPSRRERTEQAKVEENGDVVEELIAVGHAREPPSQGGEAPGGADLSVAAPSFPVLPGSEPAVPAPATASKRGSSTAYRVSAQGATDSCRSSRSGERLSQASLQKWKQPRSHPWCRSPLQ